MTFVVIGSISSCAAVHRSEPSRSEDFSLNIAPDLVRRKDVHVQMEVSAGLIKLHRILVPKVYL